MSRDDDMEPQLGGWEIDLAYGWFSSRQAEVTGTLRYEIASGYEVEVPSASPNQRRAPRPRPEGDR